MADMRLAGIWAEMVAFVCRVGLTICKIPDNNP